MAIQLTTNYQLISSFNLTYGAIRLYAKYNSQSRENNQTAYQLKEVYYCNQSGGYVGFYNGVGVVDGSTKDYGSGYTRMYYGETVIQEVSRTINHNTDGSSPIKNVAYSWSASFGGSGSSSVDISFPKIDRYPMITNASNFTDEESPTIQYSTTMGFSGASVKACIASADGGTIYVPYRDVNVSNGSYTFNLTTSERNTLRNATPDNNTLNIRFYLKTTTTGGTEYFSYLPKQMSITNANPTISDEETETDANVITYYGTSASTVVQNASKVRCEITATALKGSSISSVSIVHSGITYPTTLSSGKYVATIPMVTDNFVINVVDSRGNSSTKTVTKTMVEYSPVDFSAFTIKRINSTSSNIRFDIEAKYYQVSLNGTANAPVIKYKKDDESYVTIPSSYYTIDTTNHKVSITNYVAEGILPYTQPSQFTLYIEDLLTNDTDGGTNAYVLKGIATFEAGERDLQVNGELKVADEDGENAKNVFPNVYSTTERVIGEWTDGKPVYRSTINFTLDNGGVVIDISNLNIETIINYYGLSGSQSDNRPINFYVNFGGTAYFVATWFSNNKIYCQCSSAYNSSPTKVHLEYTKTTD